MTIDAETLLAEAEQQCEIADLGLVSVVWTGAGERHGYPWPDISINLAIFPKDGAATVYGMSLPSNIMDDVKEKVRYGQAEGGMRMTPPAPREDVVMALGEALTRFGQPNHLSLQ